MNDYFIQVLEMQKYFGINTSFDFITGRDFFSNNNIVKFDSDKNKDNVSQTKLKKEIDGESKVTLNDTQDCIDLSNVSTFDDLVDTINDFNGCELKRYAKNTVIFDGNTSANIMLIGEAPGEKEDEIGKPFCGQSGQLLRKALSCIDITNENLLITNTIYWRPPENRKPTEKELKMCLPFLLKMIEIVNPKILILCGATAIESITGLKSKMSEIVGKFNESNINISKSKINKIKTFAIYHPSYLLRQPSMKKTFWKHLLLLKDELIKDNLLGI